MACLRQITCRRPGHERQRSLLSREHAAGAGDSLRGGQRLQKEATRWAWPRPAELMEKGCWNLGGQGREGTILSRAELWEKPLKGSRAVVSGMGLRSPELGLEFVSRWGPAGDRCHLAGHLEASPCSCQILSPDDLSFIGPFGGENRSRALGHTTAEC